VAIWLGWYFFKTSYVMKISAISFIKAQFESPKPLHQTTFKKPRYANNKESFETADLGKNVKKML